MIIRGFFLAAALAGVVTALGCGRGLGRAPYDDPCLDGDKRLTECKVRGAYQNNDVLLSYCRADPIRACVADCVAEASCDDLIEAYGHDGTTCPSNDFIECTIDCDPQLGGCATPLVLSFDGAQISFETSDRFFDLGIGASVVTDWPSPATPWLALDRNRDGVIDDATELFGSSSPLQAGGRAANGFIPLRELDSDGDGRITAADMAWASLLVWSDRNGDRVSSRDELASLDAAGVTAIDLGYTRELRCDARGNCEGERAGFRFRDESGAERAGSVVDVYLRIQ